MEPKKLSDHEKIEKLSYRIRVKKGSLLVFGKNEKEYEELKSEMEKAVSELGADIGIEYISDEKEIMSYGVTQTPAIVTANYKIKSEGTIPSVSVLKEGTLGDVV